jgi:hypothetical protein
MKSFEEQIRGKCVHFTGTANDACKVGVKYETFRKSPAGGLRMPCLRDIHDPMPCDKLEWPSDEYVANRLAASKASMERVTKALAAIAEDAAVLGLRKGNGGIGEVVCPVCKKGTLQYSVASYNGHIHARCTKDGCVAFMQ